MHATAFRTRTGVDVTAVTAVEMEEVDRVAVQDVGLLLLQMMENAGRMLAAQVNELRAADRPVLVVAGNGGNGGGGMAATRHLANRDISVKLVLDRPCSDLSGAAAVQAEILEAMDVRIVTDPESIGRTEEAIIVDALIGYGLEGAVRPPADSYIEAVNGHPGPVLSLDVPSGIDATTGEIQGVAVEPDRTLTLALPKTGLDTSDGTLYLADIGIPRTVYDQLDIEYANPFDECGWIELTAKREDA